MMTADDLHEIAQGRTNVNFVQWMAGEVGHEVLEVGAQFFTRTVGRHRAEAQHLLGDEFGIIFHDAEQ